MKQHSLRGFGESYLTGATPPADMPEHIVGLCKSEADAILHSINYAKARFGYSQRDVAKLCGWRTGSHLSDYKAGREEMPRKHWQRFAQVTGCNLLRQYRQRLRLIGHETSADRNAAIVEQMLRAAA